MDSLTRFSLTTLALLTLASAPACLVDQKIGGNPTDGDDATSTDSETTSEATTGNSTDAGTDGSGTDASTDGSGTDASTDGSGTDASTGTGSTTADPSYERECEPGDFVCDDWGCQEATQAGECYKPCTPSGEIGGVDSECDEPERPFCSQLGLSFGGDFDCNGCAHVCLAEPLNWCDHGADQCE
ncbi:hypothetical protein [Nannocystis bainbridge]|uniref:Uncharacterized protein n=1 Tax=Nannocystis bainbridge TaxID=2995303 RepID=A0ABT5DV61_9BACT|nr:hypothetical protein [Nannocystis bainbridge]MDC0717532.1 hypothetical protein [Nannocystis bainbridge]